MAYNPSPQQLAFFDWVANGQGSTLLTAVAGSGKSTTIVRSLLHIPERQSVAILAFNAPVAAEMRDKIASLGAETDRAFQRVRAQTFHSLGMGVLMRQFETKPTIDPSKCRKLYKAKVDEETYELYGSFVPRLVAIGKGYGIGCLTYDEPAAWFDLIDQQNMTLDSEDANMDKAVDHASKLLQLSNRVADRDGSLDYDDQLYLPVLWKLKLWQNDWLFIDEAQDTNPIRRAIARMALRPGGRLAAVGDRNQAIYAFTGANSDSMDIIKREHRATELPLTVSYRCPKAAEDLVRPLVPHFSVHEDAPAGSVKELDIDEGIARLGDRDVVLCRNTAPLVDLAFKLIAAGRGCTVLGKEIADGLVNLIKRQKAHGVDDLVAKLEAHCQKEIAAATARGEEQKAQSAEDRTACVMTVIDNLARDERTVPKLIAKIEGMFSDGANVLTLCSMHKAKGKEWPRVAILRANLVPSKWARSDEAYQQELNLQYVSWTRFQEELIFLLEDVVEEESKEESADATA